MPSVEYLKQVVSDKLAAAAEEIFAVFHNTIVEYEEELDRHRKLIALAWKPEVKLRRIDLPRQRVSNEELSVDEQSSLDQDRTSKVDQEELQLPLIKEQQEELNILEFKLKEETEDLQLGSPNETSIKSEDPTVDWNPEEPLQDSEVKKIPVITSVVSAANIDLSHYPGVSKSQELAGFESKNSNSKRRRQKTTNSNLQKKQPDHDQDVTLPTPTTSLTDNRPHNKFNESKVQKITKNHVDKTLELSSCGTVLQHKTIHTANMPFKCQECGKSFSKRLHLERHKKTHIYAERPHACTTCGKRFLTKGHLKDHEGIHKDVRPHVCQVCHKGFVRKRNMKYHMKIHTGERPHVCQICCKRYLLASDLSRHIRRSHTDERPHVCQTCGKGFSEGCDLKQHLKVHRGK